MAAPDDHALAADLAERAGRLLLDLRARGGDPDALRNAGDRQSHEFLMDELAKAGQPTPSSPKKASTTRQG